MKKIPDFNVELAQTIDYIIGSDLAKRAFEEPPFNNFANILVDLIKGIDRLADNCHMPEFTNHALPHICSIVKRASEWAADDGWINNIEPKEAAYLLIALLVHDLGMLSQDAGDLPEEYQMDYMKGMSDVSNWVRRTHVMRIERLVKRLLDDNNYNYHYLKNDKTLERHISIITSMAASHSKWPWDKNFLTKTELLQEKDLKPERIRALNAVIAVCDLLDENASRCDTVTLIMHHHGTTENIAHWIRHALTMEVEGVKMHIVTVYFRKILPQPENVELVYRALRNHYRLVKLYNEELREINAQIDQVRFEPGDGIPDYEDDITQQLQIWEKPPEFQDCFTEQLLSTFMLEALNLDKGDNALRERLDTAGLECLHLTQYREFLFPSSVLMPEEKVIKRFHGRKDKLNYIYKLVEEAYINGDIGKVRHLCMSVLEEIDAKKEKVLLENIYWAMAYLLVCQKLGSDYYMVDSVYHNCFNMRPPAEEPVEAGNSSYQFLFDVLLAIQQPNISSDYMAKYKEHLLKQEEISLQDDWATVLLIQTVAGLFWIWGDGNDWKEIVEYYIEKSKETTKNLPIRLKEFANRLNLQVYLLSRNNKGEVIYNNNPEKVFSAAWRHFFEADWGNVKKDCLYLTEIARNNQEYEISVQGFLNITAVQVWYYSGMKDSLYDSYTSGYRYQRLTLEQRRPAFWKDREHAIESILVKCAANPNNTSGEKYTALRLIPLQQLEALQYWNLGDYIDAMNNYAQLFYYLGVYFDKHGDYAGMNAYLKEAVKYSIYALDEKLFSEQQKNKITALILEYDREGIREIIGYITKQSAKIEWQFALQWLSQFAVYLASEECHEVIEWTLVYDAFIKNQMHFNSEYQFLQKIVEIGFITEQDWHALNALLLPMFQNEGDFIIYTNLCESVLAAAPKELAVQYLDCMLNYSENEYKARMFYRIAVSISNNRSDLHKELHQYLRQEWEHTKNIIYKNADEVIEVSSLSEITKIDIQAIEDLLTEKLTSLQEQINMSGYNSVYFKDVHVRFINQNWTLANVEDVEKLADKLFAFLETNENQMNALYFVDICQLLEAMCRFTHPEIRQKIINKVLDNYIVEKSFLPYEDQEWQSKDSPLNNFHMDFNFSRNVRQSLFSLILSGIEAIQGSERKNAFILWSMSRLQPDSAALYGYATVIYSYFYLKDDGESRDLAFGGLMALYAGVPLKDGVREDLLVQIIKGLKVLENAKDWFGDFGYRTLAKENHVYYEMFINRIYCLARLSGDEEVRKWKEDWKAWEEGWDDK